MPLARILIFLLTAQTALFGTVERVVDGDTIKVRLDGRTETVRYIGVDTPETVHPTRGVEPYGKAASRFNASLVEGERVRLELDVEPRDRYGRLLAYVYVDSLFVNAELLRRGYAQLMTIPPNVRYVEEFVRHQYQAREAGAGLWGLEGGERSAEADSATVSSAEADPVVVYVTESGTRYHRGSCRYLKSSRIPLPLTAAMQQYEACKICEPPTGGGRSTPRHRQD